MGWGQPAVHLWQIINVHCQTKPIEVCRSGMENEREKEFIGKNCDIVSTLYYASPPCKITAMNLLKNQTRYISHIYDFRLACHCSQSDRVKFHTHSGNTLPSVCGRRCFVCKSCTDSNKSTDVNEWGDDEWSVIEP